MGLADALIEQRSRARYSEPSPMDLVFVAVTGAFFALTAGFVRLCERV
jgi:hypothetical protein